MEHVLNEKKLKKTNKSFVHIKNIYIFAMSIKTKRTAPVCRFKTTEK